MYEWIARAQQIHTDTRIDACETVIESSPLQGTHSCEFDSGWYRLTTIPGKFYNLTSTVLSSIKHLTSAVFPVDPSAEEINIINHVQSPAFILGRSGTGKTTCLIYKLASRYLTTKIEDEVPVRQVSFSWPEDLASIFSSFQ